MEEEIVSTWITKRKETKYYISRYQYTILKSLLQATMKLDKHADSTGDYFVRSVYLDSVSGMDFKEKEIGVGHRRKIRFRYYFHEPESIKFETKEKFNKHTIKKSLVISKDEADKFLNLDYRKLKTSDTKLYEHLVSNGYSFSTIIDYEREAYVSDLFNVRINFDKNIRGTKDFAMAYTKNPSMIPLIEPGYYILEVKHDGHVPEYIRQVLAAVDLTSISYSKYYYSCLI